MPGPAAVPRTSIVCRIRCGGLTCGVAEPRSPCEQFFKGGILADRIEVGIAFKERAGALREFDRAPKMRDGLVLLAGEAFATGDVVEQVGERWVACQQLPSSIRRLSVIARLVEW